MKLTVVHLEGSKQGQTEHAPGPTVVLGRDPSSCQIAFDPHQDLDVSANHARIVFQGEQVVLEDLGSTNGTFLNGAKVTGTVPLPSESAIQLGDQGPKVRVSFAFGPGKKTQMIDDLSHKLESSESEKEKARARNKKLACCGVLGLVVLIAGGLIASGISGSWSTYYAVVGDEEQDGVRAEAAKARERALAAGAPELEASRAAWKEAEAFRAEGKAAQPEADWAAAKVAYEKAAERYRDAESAAQVARNEALAEKLAAMEGQAQELADRAERERVEREEAVRAAIEKAEREAAERLAALEERLSAASATDLVDELRALLKSTDPSEIEAGIARIDEALAEAADPELEDLKERLQERLGSLQNVDELLAQAATSAKPMVVGIHTHVFAIPGDKTLETTKIRITVARGQGTGFFFADDRVLTTREAVSPHLFDPEALALHTKLEERGMQFIRGFEVWDASEGGPYAKEWTGEQVTIERELETEPGGEREVEITIESVPTRVSVRPHVRGANDLALLRLEGASGKFLEVAAAGPAEGDRLVALGTQLGGPGVPDDQMGLFRFDGEAKAESDGRVRLDCPSFPSWVGGPVLDPNAEVIAILVDTGTRESWSLPAERLRELIGE